MARKSRSVRIGPVSVFTLISAICLAVMAVLAVSTTNATLSAAEKHASFTTDTYVNETAAWEYVAQLDEARAQGGVKAVKKAVAVSPSGTIGDASYTATADDGVVSAEFTLESGRTLSIELEFTNKGYTINAWKANTEWVEADSGQTLWVAPEQ